MLLATSVAAAGVVQHATVQSMLNFVEELRRVAHLYTIGRQHVAPLRRDAERTPCCERVLHSSRRALKLGKLGVMGVRLSPLGF